MRRTHLGLFHAHTSQWQHQDSGSDRLWFQPGFPLSPSRVVGGVVGVDWMALSWPMGEPASTCRDAFSHRLFLAWVQVCVQRKSKQPRLYAVANPGLSLELHLYPETMGLPACLSLIRRKPLLQGPSVVRRTLLTTDCRCAALFVEREGDDNMSSSQNERRRFLRYCRLARGAKTAREGRCTFERSCPCDLGRRQSNAQDKGLLYYCPVPRRGPLTKRSMERRTPTLPMHARAHGKNSKNRFGSSHLSRLL